jgi:hypothetical protein
MKTSTFLLMSITGSSTTNSTPANKPAVTNHRWKCARCGEFLETESNFPPGNYNCAGIEKLHAWESFEIAES